MTPSEARRLDTDETTIRLPQSIGRGEGDAAPIATVDPQVIRASVIEEVAVRLARYYPDNASTNAFCAAIRSMADDPEPED